MNKTDFDKEMERRYKEVVGENGIDAKDFFSTFKKYLHNVN